MTESISRKVLFVVVEGLDSMTSQAALTENIGMLKQAGSSSGDARISSESSLAANVADLLSGLPSSATIKTSTSKVRDQSNIIHLAVRTGLSIAAFYNSPVLNRLFDEALSDNIFFINGPIERYDFKLMHLAAESIRVDRPDLCFVYMGLNKPLGGDYRNGVETCDKALGIILHVMSLFGLFRLYHIHLIGLPSKETLSYAKSAGLEIKVPWIASGPLIRAAYTIQGEISIVDTVPTLARLLNLPKSRYWEGYSIDEAFVGSANDLRSVA